MHLQLAISSDLAGRPAADPMQALARPTMLRRTLRLALPRARACPASRRLCSGLQLEHEPRPQEVVLNVSGPDRVGVVHDVAQRIVAIGGNVGESQAITVKGTFIAALALSVDVRADLQEFCNDVTSALPDFTVSILEAVRVPEESATHTAHFVVTMADHIGAVHEVTRVFSDHELSVVALKTTQEAVAGGAETFGMQGTLSSPKAIDVDALSSAIEAVEHRRGIDVELYLNPPGPAPQDLFPFRHHVRGPAFGDEKT